MADLAVGPHHPNVSMSAGVQDQPRIADEEDGSLACCCIPGLATLQEPVTVGDMDRHATSEAFWLWPAGPLLFETLGSETRDHCANERSASSSAPCPHPLFRGSLNSYPRLPVISAPVNLHGHRVGRHRSLVPSQAAGDTARAALGNAAGSHLFRHVCFVPRRRPGQLHTYVQFPLASRPLAETWTERNNKQVWPATSHRANGAQDTGSKLRCKP